MTVAALPSVVSYLEDGVTVSFPVPYRFQSAGLVVERVVDGVSIALLAGTDYTVTGGETDAGGTLNRTAATNGAMLRIRRQTVQAQSMTYTTGDRFPAASHEDALDRQMMVAQDLAAGLDDTTARALLVPAGESVFELPPVKDRIDTALVFDRAGLPVAKPIGSFPAGPAGPADNTYTTLADLVASDKTRKKANLVGDPVEPDGPFNYVAGAWVRQGAEGIAYGDRTVDDKLSDFINPLDSPYNAQFDGVTDDSAALQAAVDVANVRGVPMVLPGRTARIDAPIDLRNRYVDIRGVAGQTRLVAGAAMAAMLDLADASEIRSYSPFRLTGFVLDGAGLVTDANLSVRFRRDYLIEEIFSTRAPRGFRIRDGNSGTLRRCRTSAVEISLHSEGSNHATHHDGCSFINASRTAVLIENNGTALDGNNGLVFTACVVQDGAGDGFDVAASCSANLVGCYVGETTTGFNFVNRGGVITIDGGIVYFGFAPSNFVTRPLGGTTYLNRVQLFSQNAMRGTSWLSGLTPAEGNIGTGKIKLEECNSQFPVAGDNFFNGNVLASEPTPVFAPRLGKSYTLETNDLTATSTLSGAYNNGRRVVVDTVAGSSPIIGLQADLTTPNQWRDGEPFYLVVVYSASKPVNIRTNTGVLAGGVTTLGTLPASAAVATYVKVESIAASAPQSILEFYMTGAAVGDNITIYHVGLADAAMIKNGIGVMPNLYLP